MKNKEFKELRGKKIEELRQLVVEKKLDLIKLLVDIKISRQKNLKAGKSLKKDIARILTLVRENEISKGKIDLQKKEVKA